MSCNKMTDPLYPTTLKERLLKRKGMSEICNPCFCLHPHETRKVLVIYTGGTIGMVRSKRGALTCAPNVLENTVRKFPHLHDSEYAKTRLENSVGQRGATPLVLPEIPGENFRIVYSILEYDPLLDSSNMSIDDWIHIARDIKNNYEAFDGFVVLHGTDTMAYTASALSFMMDNLGKSVVLTGSQIPLFESRSDGRDNLLGALIMAGSYRIPEVTCFFGHRLFRGNRITKMSSDSLNAFDSPNMQPIATIGIDIQVNYNLVHRISKTSNFQLNTSLNRNVGLLRLFPSITAETLRALLQPPTMGLVLQTYGAGNFPTNSPGLLEELKKASQRGFLIVNCTQCSHGSVSAMYETGSQTMGAAGVIPGWDMTPEAAFTKLSYVLGRLDWSLEKKREMIECNLRGELTNNVTRNNCDFSFALKEAIEFDSHDDIRALRECGAHLTLEPYSLGAELCMAASKGGVKRLESYQLAGANLNQVDPCKRTPLHAATEAGQAAVVEFLINAGASPTLRNRLGHTPLDLAKLLNFWDIVSVYLGQPSITSES